MYLLTALHFEHPRLRDDEDERVHSERRSELNYLSGGFGGASQRKPLACFGGRIRSDRVDSTRPGSHSALRRGVGRQRVLGDVTSRGIGREANIWIIARSLAGKVHDGWQTK